jgi:hypothetical protein
MKKRITLTHRHLFALGWAYYLLTPLVLGYAGVFTTADSLGLLQPYFDIHNPSWPYLLSFTLLAPIAYLVGSLWVPLRPIVPREVRAERRRTGAWFLLPLYAVLMGLFAVHARSLLGAGYSGELDISLIGPMATVQMLVLYQYLYERSARHRIAGAFAVLLVFNSALLLSMGGRLYVVSALVAIYFRWWNWGARSLSKQWRSLALILCVPAALVAVGMWRMGETNYSLVGFYLVSEAVFTSISAFTLFTGGQWSGLLDVPYEFLGAFANIVPAPLWPDKANWLAALGSTTQQHYESPFGASSIVASAVGGFGFVGGILFFLVVGMYMSALGRTRDQPAREAHYCYLVGLLPFMFFRDPFQVQIKLVLTGFILYFLTVVVRSPRRIGVAPDILPQGSRTAAP